VRRGDVQGLDVPAPSVVSLNGAVASVAAMEFALLVSGPVRSAHAPTSTCSGTGRSTKSSWLTPRRVSRSEGCVQCALAGTRDEARIDERYGRALSRGNQ
jgi:hypothetical protein